MLVGWNAESKMNLGFSYLTTWVVRFTEMGQACEGRNVKERIYSDLDMFTCQIPVRRPSGDNVIRKWVSNLSPGERLI